jgi:glycerol-3-phosphate acyltransferase PlsY
VSILVLLLGYLLGSLPMGFIFLKLIKKVDITLVGSGRTGGTNAMRAGGVWLGVLTGLADLGKGYLAVFLARILIPDLIWVHIVAGVLAVVGHNWSIWLYIFTKHFAAGAGTGPNIGAAMAFFPGIIVFTVPTVLFFVFVVGYASVASLSTAVLVLTVFVIRALEYNYPWQYIIYGVLTLIMVAWALRPNIERLIQGTERRVGLFAKKHLNRMLNNTH